jgi:hypothetical protein
MTIAALHRRPSRSPYVREQHRRAHLAGDLPQIAVVPGRFDALVHRRLTAFAVPADTEPVTIGGRRPETRVQTLVDQRMFRAEQQILR